MATFLMFGKYSAEAIKGITAARTKKAVTVLKKHGGTVQAMYALLGKHDLVLVVNFPGVEKALQGSVALNKLTGIAFTTAPAIPVEDFDRLMAEL